MTFEREFMKYLVLIYILSSIKKQMTLFIELYFLWTTDIWIRLEKKIPKHVSRYIQYVQVYPSGSLRANFEAYLRRNYVYLEQIMHIEGKRVASFLNIEIDNSPFRLAAAGFYATGDGDEVRCFSCGVRHRAWHFLETPQSRDHKYGCRHRNGVDPRNVPFQGMSSSHNLLPARNGDLRIQNHTPDSVNSQQVRTLLSSPHVQNEGVAACNEEMCYEVQRLRSYSTVPVRASPMRLAQSGFYATGSGDETRCYSCRMTYSDWRLMDQPDQIHRSLSPDCPHLNRRDQRNVPMLSPGNDDATNMFGGICEYSMISQTSATTTTPFVSEVQTTRSLFPEESTPELAGLDVSQAVYPQYRDLSRRLDSYQGWGSSHVQDHQVLARAGFFYAGYSDSVRCFYCGLGLRTWEREDDPWLEHVRWRSSCDYVRLVRGEQFVRQALANMGRSVSSSSLLRSSKTQTSQHTVTRGIGSITTAEEMGFQRDDIQRAVMELRVSQKAGEETQDIALETLLEKLLLITEEPVTSIMTNNSLPSIGSPSTSAGSSHVERVFTAEPQNQKGKLEEENQSLRDESTCKICMDNPSCIVFLPCGHLATCAECAPALRKCPICRALIRGTVRTYMV